MKQDVSQGFHLGVLIVAIAILGIVAALIFVFLNSKTNSDKTSQSVRWAYNESSQEWYVQQGVAGACKDPFTFDLTPVDLSQVVAISMPGAYRGYSYKPHGGFRLSDVSQGKVDVTLPMDATLVSLSRYYEGEPATLQYLLTFESDCGIAFRFDHLYTLTPALQEIAETTPEPKLNDTTVDPNISFDRVDFKAGEIIATEVGFPAQRNYGFDFGVYDYRSRNDVSKNSEWAELHNQYQSQEWYGRCWTGMLPNEDAELAKSLSLVVVNPARPSTVSDYCEYAPYRTSDFNDGKPTEY